MEIRLMLLSARTIELEGQVLRCLVVGLEAVLLDLRRWRLEASRV